MTILFTKQHTNYHHQNIIDLVSSINDPVIQNAILDTKNHIKIFGDIHRTQFLSDNPEQYYWVRLSVNDEYGIPIIGYNGIHIFVCFRLFQYKNGSYIKGECINPPSLNNTDIADITQIFGGWEFRKITYGFKQSIIENIETKKNNKPRKKNILKIIDPKTGKEIK